VNDKYFCATVSASYPNSQFCQIAS